LTLIIVNTWLASRPPSVIGCPGLCGFDPRRREIWQLQPLIAGGSKMKLEQANTSLRSIC